MRNCIFPSALFLALATMRACMNGNGVAGEGERDTNPISPSNHSDVRLALWSPRRRSLAAALDDDTSSPFFFALIRTLRNDVPCRTYR